MYTNNNINPGDLYYLGYKKIKNKIIIIIINAFVQCHKVIPSEALGPGSVLLRRGKRESPKEEECL